MDKTTEQGIELIALFMNDGEGSGIWISDGKGGRISYNNSWNWLMPAYYKFRDLQDINMEMYEVHHDWCGNIAQAISLSESKTPTEAFSSLVEAIQWYNNSQSKTNNNGHKTN